MAEAVHGPALHEVEIALAVVVPQIGAVALDEDGGGRAVMFISASNGWVALVMSNSWWFG